MKIDNGNDESPPDSEKERVNLMVSFSLTFEFS